MHRVTLIPAVARVVTTSYRCPENVVVGSVVAARCSIPTASQQLWPPVPAIVSVGPSSRRCGLLHHVIVPITMAASYNNCASPSKQSLRRAGQFQQMPRRVVTFNQLGAQMSPIPTTVVVASSNFDRRLQHPWSLVPAIVSIGRGPWPIVLRSHYP